MNCAELEELICDYVDGTLTSDRKAEVARHGDAGGKAASFERTGGIEALVLDEDVRIFAAGEHRGEAFAKRNRVRVR